MADIVHADTKRTADRVPPGQKLVSGWPILTYGTQPAILPKQFRFRIFGAVEKEVALSWEEFTSLPAKTLLADMHCVTTWSRLDNVFRGVPHLELMKLVKIDPKATHVMIHGEKGYSTNVPLADFARPDTMFAYEFGGGPLPPAHGGPLRDMIPHLYLWKSAKWATGVEFLRGDKPGFWEERGYHRRGDPWAEERYRDDPAWKGGSLF